MKYMFRKSLAVGIILLLTLVSIPMVTGERSDYTKEEGPDIVYIAGRFLTDYNLDDHSSYSNIWHFSLIKTTSTGVKVNFSFTGNTLIWFMHNNKPKLMKGPKNFILELTDMNSFVAFWWPPFSMLGIGKAKIFAVCDSITLYEGT